LNAGDGYRHRRVIKLNPIEQEPEAPLASWLFSFHLQVVVVELLRYVFPKGTGHARRTLDVGSNSPALLRGHLRRAQHHAVSDDEGKEQGD